VVKVVIADAPTATGKRKSLMTPRLRPRVATMNANSPICAMLIPTWTDCFKGCPESSAPIVVLKNFPKRVNKVTQSTGHLYSIMVRGSINIPTDTKKTAPKRSLTGLIICSAFSA
jgi:hypothetical protein